MKLHYKTEEFLDYFKDMDNNDTRVLFADSFSEFIQILNDTDLSSNTLELLNDIFMKDMKMFFNKFCCELKEK